MDNLHRWTPVSMVRVTDKYAHQGEMFYISTEKYNLLSDKLMTQMLKMAEHQDYQITTMLQFETLTRKLDLALHGKRTENTLTQLIELVNDKREADG